MTVFAMLFAVLCVDLYSHLDVTGFVYGAHHYSDFSHGMATNFRLFVGEGWHLIMYDCAFQTNHATFILFLGYEFVNGLLMANLVLGIVISVFNEVSEVADATSIRVYDLIAPHLHNLAEREMEIVSTDLKRINWVLADIHTQIQIIIAGGSLLDGVQPVTDSIARGQPDGFNKCVASSEAEGVVIQDNIPSASGFYSGVVNTSWDCSAQRSMMEEPVSTVQVIGLGGGHSSTLYGDADDDISGDDTGANVLRWGCHA